MPRMNSVCVISQRGGIATPVGEAALESPRRSLASALERWLGTLVEVPAALLVV